MSNLINISTILIKRGNTAAASNYVGPLGELLVDTGLQTLRLQDGSTPGGMSTLVNLQQLSNVIVAIEGIQSNTANISALVANIHGANISGITSNVAILQQQLSANGIATIGGLLVGNIGFESNSYIWSVEDSQIQFSANGYNDQSGIYLNNQNVAVMYANTQLQLVAGSTSSGETWTFDQYGNLTLPGNVVFSDATVQSTAYQGPAGQTSFATLANVTTANVALKGYVDAKLALLANAPAILDTLGQIATAIQADEANIGTLLTNLTTTNANLVAANIAWQANAATQSSQITAANTTIAAFQANVGGYYVWANANVAGLYNSILAANAGGQQASINSITANIGSFYTWANTNFGTSSYANANVAAYLVANPQVGTYSNTNTAAYLAGNITTGNISVGSIFQLHGADSSLNTTNGSSINVNARLNVNGSAAGYGMVVANPILASGGLVVSGSSNAGSFYGTSYFWSNGVGLLSGAYSNTNVAAYLTTQTFYSNSNIASYLVNNPQSGTYSNTNVAAYLTTQTFYSNANVTSYLAANPQGSTYSNANIVANLQNYVTNISSTANIATTANMIAPNYLFANGVNILSTITPSSSYSNTNVAAYLPTDSVVTTLQANLGVTQIWANANIASIRANLGVTQIWANANIASINANLGSYYTWANANVAGLSGQITAANAVISALQANVGSYYTWANANVAGLSTNITGANASIATLQANLGSYYTWANANVAGLQSSITSLRTTANANTAAYLAAGISTNVTTTGNVSAGNVTSAIVNANTIYLGGNLLTINNATTPVGFRATTPVTNMSVNNGSTVTMLFGTEEVDTNSAYNPATGSFTPNIAGYYSVSWFIVTSANGAGELIASLYKNGVLVAWGTNQTTATAHWNGIGGSASMIYLNGSTDNISITLTNNSGSTATILAASGLSYFSAHLIR